MNTTSASGGGTGGGGGESGTPNSGSSFTHVSQSPFLGYGANSGSRPSSQGSAVPGLAINRNAKKVPLQMSQGGGSSGSGSSSQSLTQLPPENEMMARISSPLYIFAL